MDLRAPRLMTASPSMPTGTCAASAVISICFVVSSVTLVGPAAAEQIDGLTGGAHRDADHAERAAIQPRTGTQARGPGLPGSAPGQLTVILPAPPAR